MNQMSELYINICLKVSGKNLEAKKVNPIIDYHTSCLKELKIAEQKENGKFFKAWVVGCDEFNHELLDKNTLICSRRIRFEIRDPYPHGDNHMNFVHAKVHKGLMDLRIHHAPDSRDEILIETINTHIAGNSRSGRWPRSELDGAFR